ncbi:hypothetical protein LIER_28322 [Lithospermum erythrorhizon]|uniref:Uncharacterized protein n=1 Tax=Lithospermum erythrorhizon TaxID=34254 RepID=A0AAV3RJ62_LITER
MSTFSQFNVATSVAQNGQNSISQSISSPDDSRGGDNFENMRTCPHSAGAGGRKRNKVDESLQKIMLLNCWALN